LSTPLVCGVYRSITLTSLRNTSEYFESLTFGQLFCAQSEED
jgi:hypothetical protein